MIMPVSTGSSYAIRPPLPQLVPPRAEPVSVLGGTAPPSGTGTPAASDGTPTPGLADALHAALAGAAQALGLIAADLTAALQNGRSVSQLAAQQGTTLDTVQQTMSQAAQQHVSQRVQAGTLAPAQLRRHTVGAGAAREHVRDLLGWGHGEPTQRPAGRRDAPNSAS